MNSSFAALRGLWAQMPGSARRAMPCILAIGIFLRAFRFDLFEFKADELEGITRGLAAPAQHWWIGHGASASVHIPFGPAFSYIMGLLTAISPDPYIITSFFLAANIIILMLAVLFFAEFSNSPKQFFLCVLLFSLSPYLIIFSRKIWQPNLMLLFVIPLVLMIKRVHKDPRLFIPIGLLSSIVVQLHHSGIFYLPLLFCFVVITEVVRRRTENADRRTEDGGRRLRWLAGGFIAFIVPLIPYLNFLVRHFQQTGITQWATRASHHLCVQGALKWVLFSATGNDFWRYMFYGKPGEWNWPVRLLPGAATIFCYFLIVPFLLGVFKYSKNAVALIRGNPSNSPETPDLKDLLCPISIVFLFLIYCFVLDFGRPHHFTIILPFLILALSEGILSLGGFSRPDTIDNSHATRRFVRGATVNLETRGEEQVLAAPLDASRPPSVRRVRAVRVLLGLGLISYALQYPFVLSYVSVNNGSTGEYGICYREQKNVAEKIAAAAGHGQIRLNPLETAVALRPAHKEELQDTIAYICKTGFDTEVLFNATPQPGAKVLKLVKTGERLNLEVE